MSRPTILWAMTTTILGFAAAVAMVLLGMEPRLLLVGFVVALLGAATWLVSGLGAVTTPLTWYNHGGSADATARPDRRVQLLAARLRHTNRRRQPPRLAGFAGQAQPDEADEIVETLRDVIVDHLAVAHGIDPAADATNGAAMTAALGPELALFITDSMSARSMTQRRSLAHTISLIEEFTSSSDHT